MLLEACVETLEQALLAQQNSAHRIELCERLEVGGLTPSLELLHACTASLQIPIMVMIRPRAGNFQISDDELEQMKTAIRVCQAASVAGVVFGILTPQNEVDLEKTAELAAFAQPLQVTFHKAIDETPDPVEAAEKLSQVPGIQRILTSGGAATALEGKEVLKKMMERVGERLTILVAGKVTAENLAEVHREIGAKEYHGRRIVF
ncbi:MAG: copper homeostasis protein CutC [Bacteroidota bacterium]